LFHADGQTDRHNTELILIAAFYSFSNAPTN
jgi:hypothetical protein